MTSFELSARRLFFQEELISKRFLYYCEADDHRVNGHCKVMEWTSERLRIIKKSDSAEVLVSYKLFNSEADFFAYLRGKDTELDTREWMPGITKEVYCVGKSQALPATIELKSLNFIDNKGLLEVTIPGYTDITVSVLDTTTHVVKFTKYSGKEQWVRVEFMSESELYLFEAEEKEETE